MESIVGRGSKGGYFKVKTKPATGPVLFLRAPCGTKLELF
jgi:hypothetical protein